MSTKYSNFKSSIEIDAKRKENHREREIILTKAKEKYEKEERRREKAKQEGEGTWMLDSVSKRIFKEEKELKRSKKSKKSKKRKKKKSKKSDSSSDSSSEEESWIESEQTNQTTTPQVVKGPQLQRESWMEAPVDFIPTTSRKDIREAANREKEKAKLELEKLNHPGNNARELNPYWKNGGTGLPEENKKSNAAQAMRTEGDGGLSWLQQALERCKQQAVEEKRSLEDVAAERYGSLKKLNAMISEAEKTQRANSRERSRSREKEKYRRSHDNRDRRRRSSSKERHIRRSRSRSRDRKYRSVTSYDSESTAFQRPCSDEDERNSRKEKTKNYKTEKSHFRRPSSDEDERDSRKEKTRSYKTEKSHFRRPSSDEDERDSRKERTRSYKTEKSHFRRPCSDDEDRDISNNANGLKSRTFNNKDMKRKSTRHDDDEFYRRRKEKSSETFRSRWKKKTSPPSEEEVKQKDTKRNVKDNTSSSSSASSSGSESEQSDEPAEVKQETEVQTKILSEEEMNEMAAKILRAELMGDEDVAANLKSQLEAARKCRESSKTAGDNEDFAVSRKIHTKREKMSVEEDENVVVLSRTSKSGLVRPLESSDGRASDVRAAKKRRKKNIETHDKLGQRSKYFDDDDKFDLKSLVEQEKMGTAEDQNSMFARLAGRSENNVDFDDMMVNNAAKQQSNEARQGKDRMAAIFEHRKINAAMEKCHRCFQKVSKHLIIAIGSKTYLSLPHHKSLTPGHCLIVPMQHVSAATAMDEDVWQEVQKFRKSLVNMFSADDEDMVIMETVMHLKHFPHTVFECFPLEKELGDVAPIYFKKAIQEVGSEWSDNKKLHSLADKDVRRVVPKGFPYFTVDFGLQGGYAHVIEDEPSFSSYFGREIVGGMLDADPTLWRRPHKESFEDQRQKVLEFAKRWSPFDWTQDL